MLRNVTSGALRGGPNILGSVCISAARLHAKSHVPPRRDGSEGISAVIKRFFLLPGGLDVQAGIINACVMFNFAWAALFIDQPPPKLVTSLLKALLRAACTWRCTARFWACNVLLHPNLALSVRALKAVAGLPQSRMVQFALQQNAARRKLELRCDARGQLVD